MKKSSITLCIIALNEEKFILRAIRSAAKYVDQIVVVDGGSSDKTAFLAIKAGAEVFYKKWQDDFSRQRNFAISKAKGDWILFLDSDEVFEPRLIKSIRRWIAGNKQVDCYVFARKNYIDGKQTRHYPDRQLRLFKNNGKIKYKGIIHEQPQGWTMAAWPQGYHIIHKKSLHRQKTQSKRYFEISKKYKLAKYMNFYKNESKVSFKKRFF